NAAIGSSLTKDEVAIIMSVADLLADNRSMIY
ncbi:MAG: hypothetical protein ACI9DM_002559, partial [Cyclobacteriaceae bacterium]